MAYLSDRNHDVFISYAHDDDLLDWIKDFALMLEGELGRQLKIKENLYGKVPVEVWKDNNLPQQGNLSERLEKEIKESSIFLVIMSNSYLLSKWCNKEGIMFVNSLKGKSHLKIFIIEREETAKDKWPKFLKTEEGDPLLYIQFYDKKDVNQKKTIDMKTEQGSPNPRALRFMNFAKNFQINCMNSNITPKFLQMTRLKRSFWLSVPREKLINIVPNFQIRWLIGMILEFFHLQNQKHQKKSKIHSISNCRNAICLFRFLMTWGDSILQIGHQALFVTNLTRL